MKAFSLLFLVLITFAASFWIGDYGKCMSNEYEGQCCWWNSNSCCRMKLGQMCLMAFRQCCVEKTIDKATNKTIIKELF